MFISRAIRRSLLDSIRCPCSFRTEQIFDYRLSKKDKKLGFTKPVRPYGDFSDTLTIHGVTRAEIFGLFQSFKKETEIVLSSENIGFVLYQFDKEGLLTNEIFEILYPQLRRYSVV